MANIIKEELLDVDELHKVLKEKLTLIEYISLVDLVYVKDETVIDCGNVANIVRK